MHAIAATVGTQAVEEADERIARMAFVVTAVIAAFLHWIPHFPPQIDVSQHAAQMQMLRDWQRPDFAYRDILELNFFTPYLPAYLLGAALSFLVPTVIASKIVWTLGALGTVYATVRLRRLLGGPAYWDWLVLPGLFGETFFWGFLTFHFTVPLGLFALEYWIRYLRAPTVRRGTVFGIGLMLLFFSHSLVTAWVMLVCGCTVLAEWMLSLRNWRRLVTLGLPLLAPLPLMMAWIVFISSTARTQAPAAWFTLAFRFGAFFAQLIGLPIGYVGVSVLGLAMFGAPFLAGARIRRDPVHEIPLLVTLAIVLFGPGNLFGNTLTSSRFFSLVGPAAVIALSGAAPLNGRRALVRHAVPVLTILTVVGIAATMVAFSREQADFQRIAAHIPPKRRVLAVVTDGSSTALRSRFSYVHFPAWYQAEHGGMVEFNFADNFPMIVRFRASYTGRVSQTFATDQDRDWAGIDAARFDYILVRGISPDVAPIDDVPGTLAAHEGTWWLYAPRPPLR